MSVSADPTAFAQRVRCLLDGGAPDEDERRLALIFDTGYAVDVDVRDLAPREFALAMAASTALERDPNYVRALADARAAQDQRPEIDAIDARLDAGERVTTAEIDHAITAERRRRDAASRRVVSVAMRVRPARRRRGVRPLGTVNRPRSRRTHAQTRSYSRAGDSGGDDPPDPDPPFVPLARLVRAFWRAPRGRR